MKFTHRVPAVLALGALLLSLAGGCARSGQDVILYDPREQAEERTFLTFFGFKADAVNLTAIESALQGFMSEHPHVTITYEGLKGNTYYNALALRSKTDNLDDVLMVDHDRLTQLSREGKLADLSGVAGIENFNLLAAGQFTNADGTVYFLPTCISTYNLYINYDLLEAHHQSVPENWAELGQVCDYFVSQGIVPIIANNYASLSSLISARGLYEVYQRPDADAVIRSYDQDPDALARALAPGVEMAAEMLDRGWLDPEEVSVTNQTSDDLDLFARGERPFMISGGWATIRLPAKGAAFSYGVHPYPILEDGSVLSMQVDTCIAVSADSTAPELAREFVAYLIRPDVMWTYCDSQASYTPLSGESRLPSEETLRPSTQYLTNGRAVMRADYRMELPMSAALSCCTDVLLQGGTAEEAMEALARALTE